MFAISSRKILLLLFLSGQYSFAWRECSDKNSSAHGICPTGNTCCLISRGKNQFGCIPSDMGKYHGTCCADGNGGCPVGYQCSVDKSFISESEYICHATPSAPMADYITQRLPRYRLGSVDKSLTMLHGLDVPQHNNKTCSGRLAYYSSHGPIDRLPPTSANSIELVWIFIHGSGLNADDYLCSAMAAAEAQKEFKSDNILVIAPWFSEDSDWKNATDLPFLYWNHQDALHPWRYGADSMNHNVSSYTALDVLVQTLHDKLGSGVQIVVCGHSSGGQMVQRWTFLTKTWYHSNMRAIVANPSSYLYLTSLRKIDGRWTTPPAEECPEYDAWKWGLSKGGSETAPYRDRALPNASAAVALVNEFRHKHVTYLSGSLDVCNETEPDLLGLNERHCHSHSLETTCMDELQGRSRMERGNLYMESLGFVWTDLSDCHKRVIVPGVGHDHSLMFNSKEGMDAIFGKRNQHCSESVGLSNSLRR